MPIPAKCPKCSAKYNIIETAAGRRVKCRACKQPFQVPGELKNAKAPLNPSTLAELEKNARPAVEEVDEMIRYKAVVSTLSNRQDKAGKPAKGLLGKLFKSQ